jgi:hypothetical protein
MDFWPSGFWTPLKGHLRDSGGIEQAKLAMAAMGQLGYMGSISIY